MIYKSKNASSEQTSGVRNSVPNSGKSSELKNPEFHARLKHLIGENRPYSWAEKVGISKGAFNRIWKEGTIPGPEHLKGISEGTGVSIDWLLTGEGPMYRSGKTGTDLQATDGVAEYGVPGGLTAAEARLVALFRRLTNVQKAKMPNLMSFLATEDQEMFALEVEELKKELEDEAG